MRNYLKKNFEISKITDIKDKKELKAKLKI